MERHVEVLEKVHGDPGGEIFAYCRYELALAGWICRPAPGRNAGRKICRHFAFDAGARRNSLNVAVARTGQVLAFFCCKLRLEAKVPVQYLRPRLDLLRHPFVRDVPVVDDVDAALPARASPPNFAQPGRSSGPRRQGRGKP